MDSTAMSDDPNDPQDPFTSEYVEHITEAANAMFDVFVQKKLTLHDAIRVSGIVLTKVLLEVPLKERQRAMDDVINTIVSQATQPQ